MSTLTVTNINSANGSTDLTISTGNTTASQLVLAANGIGLIFKGNNTSNALTVNATSVAFGAPVTLPNVVSTSNLTNIGTAFYIVANGNVGVGTSSPSQKLHVNGTAFIANSAGGSGLYIGNNGRLFDDGNFHIHQTSTGALWLNSENGTVQINTQYNGDVVLTNNTGKVGIGTTSPSAKLHVNGTMVVNNNVTIVPTQPGSGNILADNNGLIYYYPGVYQDGRYAHRFVKPDMGGGIPMYIQYTSGTAGTWSNALRIGTYSGASDMLYVYGTISDNSDNIRSIPINNQTSAYVLTSADNGKTISITTGGVTVNGAVLTPNMVFTVFNNSSSNQTITIGNGGTMYQAGTANTGNRTLQQRGVATILMVASNTFVISGAGLA